MNPRLEYANVLIQQARFDLAEKELRQVLGAEPDDAASQALLALCLSGQKKYKEATQAAREAIARAPDWAFTHYVLASILDDRDRLDEAEVALREAIRLDASDPDHFALLASLHAQRCRWSDALQTADQGLALDAEHVDCANMRAMSLARLGRKTEADETIAAALARDPENALSHANRGWTMLQSGKHRDAAEHFREALRLQPGMEWARRGVIEAMKAKHLIYRLLLRYFLFMSGLSSRAQWMLIIGLYLIVKFLRAMAETMPEYAPYIMPVVGLYVLFALLTWVADPIFNLLLRLDNFGRLALSDEQTRAANFVGLCLLAAAITLALVSPFVGLAAGVAGAVLFAAAILPLSATFRCRQGWPRAVMATYTAAIFIVGAHAWLVECCRRFSRLGLLEQDDLRIGTGYFIFLAGCVLATWIALGLSAVRARK